MIVSSFCNQFVMIVAATLFKEAAFGEEFANSRQGGWPSRDAVTPGY